MPASISVIAYIAQQSIEPINEYTIQKGLAYCRLLENHIQTIRFTYFVQQEDEVDESEKGESSIGDALQLETVYLLHGKFTYLINEDVLDMIIISHVKLPIVISDCPSSPLISRFIGKTISSPSVTTMGVCISVCVTEYLRKGERPINEIVITHPSNGRLAKSITAAQKNATVQFTGVLTIHEKNLYCDALDFSFIGTRFGDNNAISNPRSATVKTEGANSPASRRALAAHAETKTSPSPTMTKTSKKTTIHEVSPAKLSSTIIADGANNETTNDDNTNNDDNDQNSPSPKRRRKK